MKESDEICLRTHDNFLLGAVEAVLIRQPKSVLIANAPVQGARCDRVVRASFKQKASNLSEKYNIPLCIKYFRRVTFNPRSNNFTLERNPLKDYIIFEFGKESYLETITTNKLRFRVTYYDPDRLSESLGLGEHKYCIAKDVFYADVVLTMPKVKTHQRNGLTNSLKILVVINGDKDYPPHHRKGGNSYNGDWYPGKNILHALSEQVLGKANMNRGKKICKQSRYLSLALWKLSFSFS